MDQYLRIEKHGVARAGSQGKSFSANVPSEEDLAIDDKNAKSKPRTPKVDLNAISREQVQDTLNLFDLNPRYGPFAGIDRMERWERAKSFGLNPPEGIKALLEAHPEFSKRDGGRLW